MRLWDVTAEVLTVYVPVVVGTTTAPAAAEPQAAGEAEFTAQLLAVEYVAAENPPVSTRELGIWVGKLVCWLKSMASTKNRKPQTAIVFFI